MSSTAPILKVSEDVMLLIVEAVAVLDWEAKRKKIELFCMTGRDLDGNNSGYEYDSIFEDDDRHYYQLTRGEYDHRLNDESYGYDFDDRVQAVVAEDRRLKEARHPRRTVEKPLRPLLAFSVTSKWIRSVAEPVVFRNVFLRLDKHYETMFEKGKGLRTVPFPRLAFNLPQPDMFWPKAVENARALCIKHVEFLLQEWLEGGGSYDFHQPIPYLIPIGLAGLLDTPRNLKRLRIQLSTDMANQMYAAVATLPFPLLPTVEELVLCTINYMFIDLCPNTKQLGCVDYHALEESLHDGDLKICIESAGSLLKLKSFTACSTWKGDVVDHIHRHLPNLEELRLLHSYTGTLVGPLNLTNMVSKFKSLQTVGVDLIEHIMKTVPGKSNWNVFDWQKTLRETKYANHGRIVLANFLLYNGPPTLENVEIRWVRNHSETDVDGWVKPEHFRSVMRQYRRAKESDSRAQFGVVEGPMTVLNGAEMWDIAWHPAGHAW